MAQPKTVAIDDTIRHPIIAFSTKRDGNMATDFANSAGLREKFLAGIGLSYDATEIIHAVHSANVAVQLQAKSGRAPRQTYKQFPLFKPTFHVDDAGIDGILTFDKGTAVGLMTADCVPLIVWSSDSYLHGIVHVGLLGTLNNIASNLSDIFKAYQVAITSTYYYLGPSIAAADYNVSKSNLWLSIREQALKVRPDCKQHIQTRDGYEFFDVQGMLREQLLAIGVPAANIYSSAESTASTSSNYFSNYQDRPLGLKRRFMSVVGYPL